MTTDNHGGPRREPRFGQDDDGFGPEDLVDEPAVERAGKTGRQRIFTIGIAVAALAGFGAIAWYATSEGRKDQASVVPVVPADTAPIKERPEQPGGLDIPNRDKEVFERINPEPGKPPVERLLPPPETPLAKPAAPPKPKAAPGPVAETPAKPPQGPIVPEAPEIAPPAPPPSSSSAATGAKPKAPKPKLDAPQVAKAPAPGGFQVQLGALRDEARAARTAAALAKKHADLFKSLTVGVVRADLGGRGVFFRLRAGPVETRRAAEALCRKLAARKQGCIVVKP